MSKLSRFLRIEGARPDEAKDPGDVGARASKRFAAIEPPKAPAAPDPFAPPPDREVQLEIADERSPAHDSLKLERRARAEAELAEAARERAQVGLVRAPEVPPWLAKPGVIALARMTTAGRIVVLGTSALLIGILAQLAGPIAWGLFPIVAAVVIGSHFLHPT